MPRITQLEPHLAPEELKARYLASKDAGERTRLHALWLVSTGSHSGRDAARLLGRSNGWFVAVARAYNTGGPQAVLAVERKGRQQGGKPASLTPTLLVELQTALEQPPPGGGLWTGKKVAAWIEAKTGKRPHRVTGWQYLYRAGHSKQTGRPAHPEAASPEERAAYQKKSSR